MAARGDDASGEMAITRVGRAWVLVARKCPPGSPSLVRARLPRIAGVRVRTRVRVRECERGGVSVPEPAMVCVECAGLGWCAARVRLVLGSARSLLAPCRVLVGLAMCCIVC